MPRTLNVNTPQRGMMEGRLIVTGEDHVGRDIKQYCYGIWELMACLQRYAGWGTTNEAEVHFSSEAAEKMHYWLNNIRVSILRNAQAIAEMTAKL